MATLANNYVDEYSGSKFIAKTFLFMFIALLWTAVVSLGLGALFTYLLLGPDRAVSETATNVFLGLMIGSAVVVLIMTLWIQLSLLRGKHSLVVPFALYATAMGVLLSSFTLYLDFYTLALAVGLTSLIFGLMALIGFLGGDRIKAFGMIGIGLLFGAIILSLFASLIYFFNWGVGYYLNLGISAIMFLAIILITAFDVYRIKKIAESGYGSKNLALYCAFSLYVDFIYILIRILSLLARNRN